MSWMKKVLAVIFVVLFIGLLTGCFVALFLCSTYSISQMIIAFGTHNTLAMWRYGVVGVVTGMCFIVWAIKIVKAALEE